MFAWLRELLGLGSEPGAPPPEAPPPPPERAEPIKQAIALQQAYWTLDRDELDALAARGVEALDHHERLRLLHLLCLLALDSDEGRAALDSDDFDDSDAGASGYLGERVALLAALLEALRAPDSPWRPRPCLVWQERGGSRPPDRQGMLRNASLTHLGALEIIRLDEDRRPASLDFVPFDDLRAVLLANPGLFRLAQLMFEDGHEETVVVPLLYGISWASPHAHDTSGQLTRFICHLDGDAGLGVGHQDLVIDGGEQRSLFGIGSVAQIGVPLWPEDSRFDEKCRGRGVDPVQARRP